MPDLMAIRHLTVDYCRDGEWRNVIRDLDLTIAPGEVLGLAGESGCGKSTLASVLLGERRTGRRIRAGSVEFDGVDLAAIRAKDLRRLHSSRLALVPQDGGASLTPTLRIGSLFAEALRAHRPHMTSASIAEEALRHLGLVGLLDPAGALTRLPHQFSGGQQQRIALALAVCRMPDLLILDEPTTGQDALTRRGIVDLLRGLRRESRMSMLYVSHDLATLGEVCDRIAIMYAGEIVEIGPMAEVLERPRHPYARALVASLPRLDSPPDPSAALSGTLDRRVLPKGCLFAPRCAFAEALCHGTRQTLDDVAAGHAVACRRLADLEIKASRRTPQRIPA